MTTKKLVSRGSVVVVIGLQCSLSFLGVEAWSFGSFVMFVFLGCCEGSSSVFPLFYFGWVLEVRDFGVAVVAGIHIDYLAVGVVVINHFMVVGVGGLDHPPLLLLIAVPALAKEKGRLQWQSTGKTRCLQLRRALDLWLQCRQFYTPGIINVDDGCDDSMEAL